MVFCEDCDALLQPRKIDGEIVPVCPDCGYVNKDAEKNKISFVDEERLKDPDGGKMLVVEENKKGTVGRSKKEMFCEKCNSMEMVEYWEIQTRSADESPTRFFQCLTCSKNWREYD